MLAPGYVSPPFCHLFKSGLSVFGFYHSVAFLRCSTTKDLLFFTTETLARAGSQWHFQLKDALLWCKHNSASHQDDVSSQRSIQWLPARGNVLCQRNDVIPQRRQNDDELRDNASSQLRKAFGLVGDNSSLVQVFRLQGAIHVSSVVLDAGLLC